jgi:hypothetical protein
VDFYGGSQITVRWHELKASSKWTVHESGYAIRVEEAGFIKNRCNYGEILRDMSKLGTGLVEDILVKDINNKWRSIPSAL